MGWDYAYGLRLDSEGSATAFGAAAGNVRILPEVAGAGRANPSTIANRHGSVQESRLFIDSYDFVVEITLSYGTPELPANVYENRSTILERFNNPYEKKWLTRTAPHQGTVEQLITVLRPIRTGNPRHRLMIPCRALEPFWRDTSVTHNAVNPVSGITVGGDAPIADGVFVFTGGTNQALTHTTSGETITLTGSSTPAITVDLSGPAITVQQSAANVDSVVTGSAPEMIELRPGSNAFTLSGGGSVSFTGRDKWY